MTDKDQVTRLKTPGGTDGSTPKLPTSGVERGAKSTTERVEKQKVNDGDRVDQERH